MIFIILTKWKQAPTKQIRAHMDHTLTLKELEKQGIKIRAFWTLGRYDGVTIMEAPTEKDAMKFLLPYQDLVDSETMVAIPREEVTRLL